MPSRIAGNFQLIYNYLNHFLKATDEHSLQAPFIYDLYKNVIKAEKDFYAYEEIEQLRNGLLKNHKQVNLTNFGAASRILSSDNRKISDIIRTSVSPPKTSKLLFRLINYFKPLNIVELGTSVGLNTLYLASVNSKSQVYTFEGCPQLSSLAKENFGKLNKRNIELITGNIDHTLPGFLKKTDKINFSYIDANHQYAPTLQYFDWLLSKSDENTVLVFDDIHWSKEMNQAWEDIRKNSQVGMSIDLFSSGIIILKKFLNKQHYILSY